MTARDLRRGGALLLAFLAYLTAAGALTNLVAPEKAPAGSQVYAPRSIPTAADRSRPLIPTRAAPEARASRVSIPTREPSLHWTALAACESSNDPRAVSPSGRYRGLYQFDLPTWHSVGGAGDPARASRADLPRRTPLRRARLRTLADLREVSVTGRIKDGTRNGEPEAFLRRVIAEVNGAGCRDWPFSLSHGYAQWRSSRASHHVLRMTGRPRSAGAVAMHSCDRPICIAPWHLAWGTNADNTADMIVKGRMVILRGEQRAQTRLTAEQVQEIRRQWSGRTPGKYGKPSLQDLADEFGVSFGLIGGIVRGERWRHVA